MRRFFSYGPIDSDSHFYAPRKALIEKAYNQLIGRNPKKSGHYITVWAPRQCGKTWVMQEVVETINQTGEYDYEAGILSMERAKEETDETEVVDLLIEKLQIAFDKSLPSIKKTKEIPALFTKQYFEKPVILILDEFDALEEIFINRFASIFRDIFISRTNERDKQSNEKTYLLHGLALVGVRSVLGIESKKGSPFNVQRSLHIPNLTYDEVKGMFEWYEKESGHAIKKEVSDRLFYETRGQPGLTCWFGELLTEGFEGYTVDNTLPIGPGEFEKVYRAAISRLPNNNILNIISKAKQEPYTQTVMELFKTDQLVEFKFDNKKLNFLYMNGVIEPDIKENEECYVKFASPFVQKRLFNYFSDELFGDMGRVIEPFDDLEDAVTDESLNIKNILERYKKYLSKNSHWLFKDAPRRKDLRIMEAVFHFNVYMYLHQFLRSIDARVYPEFPTGNGKIDLLIHYKKHVYGIELKTFRDVRSYQKALLRAAEYGEHLGLAEITLVFFVESINEKTRQTYEKDYCHPHTNVTVKPFFIQTSPAISPAA